MRLFRLLVSTTTALVLAALMLWAAPAGADKQNSGPIQVKIEKSATLVDGSIDVSIRIRCQPVGDPFERNVTVTQDDQSIFAQRGLPDVPCDNKWHTVAVRATPVDGAFHRGQAYVSAYVSRMDPVTFETYQGQDTRDVRVRAARR